MPRVCSLERLKYLNITRIKDIKRALSGIFLSGNVSDKQIRRGIMIRRQANMNKMDRGWDGIHLCDCTDVDLSTSEGSCGSQRGRAHRPRIIRPKRFKWTWKQFQTARLFGFSHKVGPEQERPHQVATDFLTSAFFHWRITIHAGQVPRQALVNRVKLKTIKRFPQLVRRPVLCCLF